MALTRGRLSNVTAIAGAANANVVTVANNKKVYVKSIAIHDGSGAATGTACTAYVYVVPNGGSPGNANRMFNVALTAKETVLIEPAYPIVLEDTGDTINVAAVGGTINVLVNGDKEV